MQELRQMLWDHLIVISKPYFQEKEYIDEQALGNFFKVVLKESNKYVPYIVKYMSRKDSQNISLIELGNYLFKTYCPQLQLQKQHKDKKMNEEPKYAMNFEVFQRLTNSVFNFLGVNCPSNVLSQIFSLYSENGYITYTDYYQTFNSYVWDTKQPLNLCSQKEMSSQKQQQAQKPQKQQMAMVQQQIKESNFNMRTRVNKIICHYIKVQIKVTTITVKNISFEKMAHAIASKLSQSEMKLLIDDILDQSNLVSNSCGFVSEFRELKLALIGINSQQKHEILPPFDDFQMKTEKSSVISTEEHQSQKIETIQAMKDEQLTLKELTAVIFKQIDTNKDGFITSQEYQQFMKKTLGKEIKVFFQKQPVNTTKVRPKKDISYANLFPNSIYSPKALFSKELWEIIAQGFASNT